MIPSGFIAVLAGWVTTETGRQPWIVYGLMQTARGVSEVPGASVATSLALFILVYGFIFGSGLYYIARLIRIGPLEVRTAPSPTATPARPMSAAEQPLEGAK
jgi:cytochrome d ubiquinol oxidase subunit I